MFVQEQHGGYCPAGSPIPSGDNIIHNNNTIIPQLFSLAVCLCVCSRRLLVFSVSSPMEGS